MRDWVVLTSSYPSPYSSELFVLDGGWSASRILLCVRVHRLGTFGFLLTPVAQRNYILHNANKQISSKLNKPQFSEEIQFQY